MSKPTQPTSSRPPRTSIYLSGLTRRTSVHTQENQNPNIPTTRAGTKPTIAAPARTAARLTRPGAGSPTKQTAISRGVTKPSIPTRTPASNRSSLAGSRPIQKTTAPVRPLPDPTPATNIQAKMETMENMMSNLLSQMSLLQSQLIKPPSENSENTTPAPTTAPTLPTPPPVQPFQLVPIQVIAPPPKPAQRPAPKPIKKQKKPKEKKAPVVDTSMYTNQIQQSYQQVQDLLFLQGETKNRFQIEVDTKSNQIALIKSQLESIQAQTLIESEKKTSLLCQLNAKEDEKNQLQLNINSITQQLTEEIEQTTTTLTAELQETTNTCAGQLQAVQTQLDQEEDELSEAEKRILELEERIKNQKERTRTLESQIRTSETLRKKLHNEIQELKGNIRVICRVRPLLGKEINKEVKYVYPKNNQEILIENRASSDVTGRRTQGQVSSFSFDRVFGPTATQKQVFEEISHLVQSSLDGYNCCIFAFGQTGSGKTFTMEGPSQPDEESCGMIARAVSQIFESSRKLKELGWNYEMHASFLEIYNDTLRDLLLAKPTTDSKLEISNNVKTKQTEVPGLSSVKVVSPERVFELFERASSNRRVASTDMNDRSSRSHSIFQLKLEGKNSISGESVEGILNLIDLAGSEKLNQSNVTGIAKKEAIFINTSLSHLGKCIAALASNQGHIPYRDSKLTRVLQNSLGGSAKTLMFVNVSPADAHVVESLSSLRFAAQANACDVGVAQKNKKVKI